MNKEDEKLFERIKEEEVKHGLVLEENGDENTFHKVMKRLIDESPAPKRSKRGITRSRGERK
jgi:hypothetical protein